MFADVVITVARNLPLTVPGGQVATGLGSGKAFRLRALSSGVRPRRRQTDTTARFAGLLTDGRPSAVAVGTGSDRQILLAQFLVLEHLGRGPVEDDAAGVEDDGTVGELQRADGVLFH